jgi:hypothetical protein
MDKWQRFEALQKKNVGGLFLVPLTDTQHVFAHFLADSTFAFYDYLTSEKIPDFAVVAAQPILFRVSVMSLVFSQRHVKWHRVVQVSIPATLEAPNISCQRSARGIDKETGEILYNYYRSINLPFSEPEPITREECETLELSAVWHPTHVIQRLKQHYKLVPNAEWLNSFFPNNPAPTPPV